MKKIKTLAFPNLTAQQKIAGLWLIICVALVTLVWVVTFNIINGVQDDLRDEAMHEASNRARSFAEQAEKNIAHIDQISLMLRYQWQRDGRAPDIADQYKNGMHLKLLSLAIIDTSGIIISARAAVAMGMNMSDLPLFTTHRSLTDKALLINPISVGRGSLKDKATIRFTRRMDKPDGSFGGIVLVSTAASYLTHFNEFNELHPDDFISLQFDEGPLLVSRTINDDSTTAKLFKSNPQFRQLSGVKLEPGELFLDGKERYVAWEKIEDYPLRAIASITVDNALSSFKASEQNYILTACTLTLLLMATAVFLTMMQQRNAIRKRNIEQVQHTFRLAIDGAREAFYMMIPQRDSDGAALGRCSWLLMVRKTKRKARSIRPGCLMSGG